MPMTPAQQDAARALAKHPRFVPQRGMTGVRDAPGKADNLRPELVVWGKGSEDDFRTFGCIPDLNDPATVGALADVARAACNTKGGRSDYLCAFLDGREWCIGTVQGDIVGCLRAHGEPIVAASEGEAWAKVILSLPHA